MSEITEQFYSQVSESIKLVFDLTSRIDERVKILMEKQSELDDNLKHLLDIQNSLISRITILESKDISSMNNEVSDLSRRLSIIESTGTNVLRKEIEHLKEKFHDMEFQNDKIQSKSKNIENNINRIVDLVFKLGFVLITGYLLWKFGWQAPP